MAQQARKAASGKAQGRKKSVKGLRDLEAKRIAGGVKGGDKASPLLHKG